MKQQYTFNDNFRGLSSDTQLDEVSLGDVDDLCSQRKTGCWSQFCHFIEKFLKRILFWEVALSLTICLPNERKKLQNEHHWDYLNIQTEKTDTDHPLHTSFWHSNSKYIQNQITLTIRFVSFILDKNIKEISVCFSPQWSSEHEYPRRSRAAVIIRCWCNIWFLGTDNPNQSRHFDFDFLLTRSDLIHIFRD